jgi:hypothetical protein
MHRASGSLKVWYDFEEQGGKLVRSYVTQNIFGPLQDRSWAYMLQNCELPIQCTRESFRMFLVYPYTHPHLT